MSGNDYPPPGQHTITEFRPEQEHADPNDYPPPGQHTIAFKPKKDHVEPSMPQQNVPLGKQTMPQQNVPLGKQTMPQQNIPTGQQPMPQMQNVQPMPQMQNVQQMPQMQYVQQMPQQQYVMGGQATPPQQQYVQPMPRQQYYQQPQQNFQQPQQNFQQLQQMPGQPMPQYYQKVPGQQFSGSGGQPMPSPMVGQPMPSPMVGQPMASPMNLQLQPWTTGLFDCAHDMENSIITFFCPCITFGQIAELTDRGMTTCSSAGLIYGLLLYFTGLHWIYSWMYRTRMRAAYSLPEEPFHDCLVHAICDPCALCQEYREFKNRGFNMNLGWIGNMQLKAQQEAAAGVPPPVQGMIR
ncbi:uncharacterized protein LOC144575695 [Carex rostrata]